MSKIITIDQVREFFTKQGCRLLSGEYKNAHAKLEFLCSNGHERSTTWNSFQQGARCSMCAGNQKKSFELVKDFFEKEGYKILSKEYLGAHSMLEYLCPKGHHGQTCWSRFSQGQRCPQCLGKDKVDINIIRSRMKKEGYTLLSNEYTNNCTKLVFLCPNRHEGSIEWRHFKRGDRCGKCFYEKREFKLKQKIRKTFESLGYKVFLDDNATNSHSPISYQCPNGHDGKIEWYKFRSGYYRCSECQSTKMLERIKGELDKVGYQILTISESPNAHSKFEYRCPKGHKSTTDWDHFKQGNRCPECAGNQRLTIELISPFFEKEGYKLLSNKYINAHSKLDCQCSAGHDCHITWGNFKQGYRCTICQEWKHESELGKILKQIFPGLVKGQDHLDFLGRQTVDFSIRNLKLAFEYDGEQHFMPVQYGGMSIRRAKKNLEDQHKRDERKNRLCQEKEYVLIRVAYYEDLTLENIQKKINQSTRGVCQK